MHTRTPFVLVVLVTTLGAQGTITSTAPSSVQSGVSTFLMVVNGSGFTSANIVQWDGVNLSTAFASGTQLAASVTASLVASGGTHSIRVKQSLFVNSFSNIVTFNVNNPVPTIATVSPGATPFGSGPITVDFAGTNFVAASVARIGGINLATIFVSATHIQGVLTAAMSVNPGLFPIEVFNPAPGGGTAPFGSFTVLNQLPTLATISPTTVTAGIGGMNLIANGSNYNGTSMVLFDGSPLPTALLSSAQVTAAVSAALVASGASHAITVFNPNSGGGTSASRTFTVINPVPTMSFLSPSTASAGVPNTLTITGTGFNPTTTVLADAIGIPTTFTGNPNSVTAVFTPPNTAAGTTASIRVANPAPGGGVSVASFPVSIDNPVPVISSISASVILGGGSNVALTMTGSGFLPSTLVDASGTPIAKSFVSSSQLNLTFPSSLQRAIRTFALRATNAGPGGGSTSTPFTVDGPAISSCAPAVVPVMTGSSPPITLAVNGGAFQAGDVIRINGAVQPTTLVNAQTLHCTLTGSMAVLLQPGGFAVTVTRPHLGAFSSVSSNAFGVPVGIAGTPDNAGTVTLAPTPPAPGQAFSLRVELPVAGGPVTLLAQVPAPPTVLLNFAPGFDLVVGPGLNSPIILTDGLGIFGPVTPTFVTPYDLSSFGIPAGHGLFEVHDLGAPAVPLGITFSLAAVYVDPTSPIGVNATHVGGPFSL